METQQLVKEINSLPADALRELERFLVQLKWRYAQSTPPTQEEIIPLTDPEFFGMYANRDDMRDSVEYIRKLRREQWEVK
ncbi:hypothetical protein [Hymenobacter weizhouensis]|uniref:hypothetical protein n=1 Tax=Hymenobacter sp. YIM 151500-1 TaxID=2987689 RepID=UPI0022266A76|nr:hypothetical protein [Hymenobacter sp. YIM 151500-1]UYZ63017.1 hypothetical protein OIS53_18740 [Hymenobacter sp. YIM 151500-1]